jgi:hypothetical protein
MTSSRLSLFFRPSLSPRPHCTFLEAHGHACIYIPYILSTVWQPARKSGLIKHTLWRTAATRIMYCTSFHKVAVDWVRSSGVASGAAARLASKVTSISLNTKGLRHTRALVVFDVCNRGLNSQVACRGSPFPFAVQCSLLRNFASDQRCTRRPAWNDAGFVGAVETLQPYCQI